ncbi:MAG: hypothetical protein GC181_02655 [Bacteroidetes bacterium]|nr:hypothetical protein [Bacteroidota bacterium]
MQSFRRGLKTGLLLFIIFITYRFAFRTDFEVMQILQIIFNSISDILVCSLIFITYQRAQIRITLLQKQWIKNFLWASSGALLFVSGVFVLKEFHRLIYMTTGAMNEHFLSIFDTLSYQIFDSYLVVAFGLIGFTVASYREKLLLAKRQKEELEKEQIATELKFLKAQINPHFIFNTLNNIHFSIDEQNATARKLIHDFSEILRYQLYEGSQDRVSVRSEIEYLKKYIRIQQVRKEVGFRIESQFEDFPDLKIAPMLLIIPVENAFKYSPGDADGFIRINLKSEDGHLIYKVQNNCGEKTFSDKSSGGLGLSNLRKRLQLIYGDDASLKHGRINDVYSTSIRIKINTDA